MMVGKRDYEIQIINKCYPSYIPGDMKIKNHTESESDTCIIILYCFRIV